MRKYISRTLLAGLALLLTACGPSYETGDRPSRRALQIPVIEPADDTVKRGHFSDSLEDVAVRRRRAAGAVSAAIPRTDTFCLCTAIYDQDIQLVRWHLGMASEEESLKLGLWHRAEPPADPNAVCELCGRDPLAMAIERGNEEVLKLLIDAGARADRSIEGTGPHDDATEADWSWDRRETGPMTPLELAISEGAANLISILIEHGADPNATDQNGRSLLCIASYLGSPDVVGEMLAAGADVTFECPWGLTPLHYAVLGSNTATTMMPYLAGPYADIDERDIEEPLEYGWVAVGHSIEDNVILNESHRVVAQMLLESGAAIDAASGKRAETPLFLAAYGCNTPLVQFLLEHGADPNKRIADMYHRKGAGWTPLNCAAYFDYRVIGQLLLDHGAEMTVIDALMFGMDDTAMELLQADPACVDDADPILGHTALIIAVAREKTDLVHLMLDLGADVSAQVRYGNTALSTAVRYERADMVKLLLDYGAEMETEHVMGSTPLMWAVERENLPIAKMLLDGGALPSGRNRFGQTPLHAAAYAGSAAAAELLLGRGADPNVFSVMPYENWIATGGTPNFARMAAKSTEFDPEAKTGWTPLHQAFGELDIMKMLLAAGADATVAAPDGETLLHEASQRGSAEEVALLLGRGIDVNAKNSKGRAAIYYADVRGDDEIIRLLLDNGAEPAK